MGFIRSAKSSLPTQIETSNNQVSEETLEILGKPQPGSIHYNHDL